MWGRGKLATTRKFFAALGSADADACAALLHPEVRYIDTRGNAIEGREACAELLRRLFLRADGVKIAIDSIADRGDYALARGRTETTDPKLAGDVLWKVRTTGDLVSEVEAHRADAIATARVLMPDYLAAKPLKTPPA